MSDKPVLMTCSEGVAHITLNRPAFGNAINMDLAGELEMLARQCEAQESTRCVMLSGAGRLFCAGGDLGLLKNAGNQLSTLLSQLAGTLHSALSHFARMQKPLLTLVNGPAAGAGLSLALAGDVVLAAQSAHFTCAYTGVGLTPDGGMTWMLPRLIGMRKAQEMLLTNRRVMAGEAEQIGLVTRVVSDESLMEEGAKVASTLASSATRAIGVTRSLILESFDTGFDSQLSREARAIAAAGKRRECAEGIGAFAAKRPPNFSGV
jgi:2-(1,2-epoxy-1,2-dihydrophenyl)acetyl-CoA isomerase